MADNQTGTNILGKITTTMCFWNKQHAQETVSEFFLVWRLLKTFHTSHENFTRDFVENINWVDRVIPSGKPGHVAPDLIVWRERVDQTTVRNINHDSSGIMYCDKGERRQSD